MQNTINFKRPKGAFINPKMDMQNIVTQDGFGVRADPRECFVKNATLNENQS